MTNLNINFILILWTIVGNNALIQIYEGDTSPGSVWPQPYFYFSSPEFRLVSSSSFLFNLNDKSYTCDILTEALNRYANIIENKGKFHKHSLRSNNKKTLTTLDVALLNPCEQYPSLEMNETYDLTVNGSTASLTAECIWGILRGLETFSQLLWELDGQIVVNETAIHDQPRFAHRGILIDTSRHYLPVGVILRNLDAMAYNKFNVFHWHIVDDQSFPYVSKAYPNLSAMGAYSPKIRVYTAEDIATVIEYARLRGIRVIPEFDTPGHTKSWGKGQPDLLTPCYEGSFPDGTFGPVNPIVNSTYSFMSTLFTELRKVFPDKYIHLGGDEIVLDCWKSNPDIIAYMMKHDIADDYSMLEQVYIKKLLKITEAIGFKGIVWQEVFDNGVQIKEDTLVEVWKNWGDFQMKLSEVTGEGYKALISAPWYLNYISSEQDWKEYYTYEPLHFNGTDEQKKLVVGGEACMWAEFVDGTNLLSRLWPRASAVAERLWSPEEVDNPTTAALRLHQHRCTLLSRGIPAEPLYSSFCSHDLWDY